jgi:hypothetical protein
MSGKLKKFRIKYTENVLNEFNEWEHVTNQVEIETHDIKWTLEQFGRNRNIVKYDIKEFKI